MFTIHKSFKSFKQRSQDVISVFTKTIADLTKINKEIEEHNAISKNHIDILTQQIDENLEVIALNEKVITNCSKILE